MGIGTEHGESESESEMVSFMFMALLGFGRRLDRIGN